MRMDLMILKIKLIGESNCIILVNGSLLFLPNRIAP